MQDRNLEGLATASNGAPMNQVNAQSAAKPNPSPYDAALTAAYKALGDYELDGTKIADRIAGLPKSQRAESTLALYEVALRAARAGNAPEHTRSLSIPLRLLSKKLHVTPSAEQMTTMATLTLEASLKQYDVFATQRSANWPEPTAAGNWR